MSNRDPIERALDRMAELRHADASASVVEEVRGFLRNRSNLVVAKAAKLTRESRMMALIPDLAATFKKLMKDAPRLDKRCAAVTEIVGALYELDYEDPEAFLAGLHHVQMEASYGPPVDAGADMRALSAQGLLRTRYADALEEVVPLLVDREPAARIGAVRALAMNGGTSGILLLRLKTLIGDSEAEVMGECFAGLLAASPSKSVGLVAGYIDAKDDATAEAAMLALGESRLPAAYEILMEKWSRTVGKSGRKVLLVSIAATRLDEAMAFLISLVKGEGVQTALDALESLAIYRNNEVVSEAISAAVATRRENALTEQFQRDFGAAR